MESRYKQKYLKYKAKYLNLKRSIGGGNSDDKNNTNNLQYTNVLTPAEEEKHKQDELIKKKEAIRIQREREMEQEMEREREQRRLEIKRQRELQIAEERTKMEEDAKIEQAKQLEIKNNLKTKLETFKLKDEDCTARFRKGNCKKSIIEFNSYIETEIDYVMNHEESPVSKQLLVIGHLNKLIDIVDKDKTKKIIGDYKDKRSRIKFYLNPNLFFDILDEIKKEILSL